MSRPRASLDADSSFMDHGACNGDDPDLFFPPPGRLDLMATAKAICARCPVREECLDYALVTRQVHGVWGGMSERERSRIRRRRRTT